MDHYNKLGNIEFLHTFLLLHYRKYELLEEEKKNNPMIFSIIEDTASFLNPLLKKYELNDLYNVFFREAQNRKLAILTPSKNLTFSQKFLDWEQYMKNHPTYIREIRSTNYLGSMNITNELFLSFLDFPVREACTILNKKGYITYWSSANRDDYFKRREQIIENMSIAYILIDPKNLSNELKEKLKLQYNEHFWGRALTYSDFGSYYGIYAEIVSENMFCSELSAQLNEKALELPSLLKGYNK